MNDAYCTVGVPHGSTRIKRWKRQDEGWITGSFVVGLAISCTCAGVLARVVTGRCRVPCPAGTWIPRPGYSRAADIEEMHPSTHGHRDVELYPGCGTVPLRDGRGHR